MGYSWRPKSVAQKAALDSPADILFYGGSVGSLKTETMLIDAVSEHQNPNLRAIIFRSSFSEMTDIVDKTRTLYTPLGGHYVGNPRWEWTFPSGAIIRLAYMSRDEDVWKYLGPRYSFIGFDESTLHTEKQVRNIMARLSSTDRTLRLRVRLASNPGNIGAAWHQKIFLRGHCPVHEAAQCSVPGELYYDRTWSDGEPIPFSVAFIPGKMSDHNLLDADYAKRVSMMDGGSAAAMGQGCWCVVEGTYFSFLTKDHRRPIGEAGIEWWHSHFLSLDYGFGKSSSSVGLYVRGPAEIPQKVLIPGVRNLVAMDGPSFPNGRIRKIGELIEPNVPAYELAQMAVERFVKPDEYGQRRRIVAAYLDPSNFKEIGDGHTIADQINEVFGPWDIVCEKASNDRLGGWQLLYQMMRTGEFEICDTCPKTFEALRTRMHDEKKPGDIKKIPGAWEDDAADETRYALYTFINQADKPRELILAEAVQHFDRTTAQGMTSSAIMYQKKAEELDRGEQPVRFGRRKFGMGMRRG